MDGPLLAIIRQLRLVDFQFLRMYSKMTKIFLDVSLYIEYIYKLQVQSLSEKTWKRYFLTKAVRFLVTTSHTKFETTTTRFENAISSKNVIFSQLGGVYKPRGQTRGRGFLR